MLLLPPEKVQSNDLSEGLPLPEFLGNLLQFFKENIRPKLLKQGKEEESGSSEETEDSEDNKDSSSDSNVFAMWINQKGLAMGKFLWIYLFFRWKENYWQYF